MARIRSSIPRSSRGRRRVLDLRPAHGRRGGLDPHAGRRARSRALDPPRAPAGLVLLAMLGLLLTACGAVPSSGPSGGVRVLAAEDVWGSIAAQLGGRKVSVRSIIVNPAQDPHAYEPTSSDARTLASAQLAIVNGVGYDPWASRLIAANPTDGRIVLDVGYLLGLKTGANPHRWYDPGDLEKVANAITRELGRLDPKDRPYFAERRAGFETRGLARYHALINTIRIRYTGVRVGASESIFALLAPTLGLQLITPPAFIRSVSEGTEPTAQNTITAERQLTSHQIKVWLYNSQNTTPEIQRLNGLARAAKIPIATITETLSPANLDFEQWQVLQLQGIERALGRAIGR